MAVITRSDMGGSRRAIGESGVGCRASGKAPTDRDVVPFVTEGPLVDHERQLGKCPSSWYPLAILSHKLGNGANRFERLALTEQHELFIGPRCNRPLVVGLEASGLEWGQPVHQFVQR